eukprot:1156263-Pelagomonas_calceolata.AAC.11
MKFVGNSHCDLPLLDVTSMRMLTRKSMASSIAKSCRSRHATGHPIQTSPALFIIGLVLDIACSCSHSLQPSAALLSAQSCHARMCGHCIQRPPALLPDHSFSVTKLILFRIGVKWPWNCAQMHASASGRFERLLLAAPPLQSARDIHGNMRTLDEFRGKVVIVTNVASKARVHLCIHVHVHLTSLHVCPWHSSQGVWYGDGRGVPGVFHGTDGVLNVT